MKRSCFVLLILIVLLISVSAQQKQRNYSETNTQPQIFGAEKISVGNVYRGSFAPDGQTFYFFKNVTKGEEDYRIFVSKFIGGKWTEPERLNIGGNYSDLYPSISKDGKRIVFTSYRPAPGDTSEKPNSYLWYAEKKENGWGAPVFISSVNKFGHYHSWAEIGSDGNLYFRQTTPDWKMNQTFVSHWNGKEYTTPDLFKEIEGWKNWKSDVQIVGGSLSPDGKALFLDVATTNPQTGKGASDIWVSIKAGNKWMEPEPLGAEINGDGYENFHFFSPNGKELYFVRDFNTFYKINLKTVLDSIVSGNKKR